MFADRWNKQLSPITQSVFWMFQNILGKWLSDLYLDIHSLRQLKTTLIVCIVGLEDMWLVKPVSNPTPRQAPKPSAPSRLPTNQHLLPNSKCSRSPFYTEPSSSSLPFSLLPFCGPKSQAKKVCFPAWVASDTLRASLRFSNPLSAGGTPLPLAHTDSRNVSKRKGLLASAVIKINIIG